MQIVYAAAVDLVCRSILADGQSVYKPLLEIVPVFGQYSFQGIVQKLQILFQLGKVASCDIFGKIVQSAQRFLFQETASKLT